MSLLPRQLLCLGLCAGSLLAADPAKEPLRPIPDKLVVLTFDDGNASDLSTVAPILEKHGFGATFFITSGWLGAAKRLTWPEVLTLHRAGFEIGCHTQSHPNLLRLTADQIEEEVAAFDRACAAHGLPKATAFSYPGGHFDRRAIRALEKHGYQIARRGRDPERPLEDNGGNGRAYIPDDDHPLLLPSAMTRGVGARGDEHLVRALAMAADRAIAILTYHGVPDVHRHCSTSIERFTKDMQMLKDSGATVIALRDLARYVDLSRRPQDPFAPIVRRLGLHLDKLRTDTSRAVPRFSWKPDPNGWKQEQIAYRILVASSRERLAKDDGDLWDSGRVPGAAIEAAYRGKALSAGSEYWWKVQCWNRRDPKHIESLKAYQSAEMIRELGASRAGPFSSPRSFKTSGRK